MLNANFFDNLAKQISNLLPSNLQNIREDFEKNIHITLQSVFSKLNLITREEFDIQVKMLQKMRERISHLEEEIKSLEQNKQ